jgi:hypothetical protein
MDSEVSEKATVMLGSNPLSRGVFSILTAGAVHR